MKFETETFGSLADGTEVKRFRLINAHGHEVSFMNYGASLLDVRVPNRDGKLDNVNITLDKLETYVAGHPGIGASIGRYANRIGGAAFTIDDKVFELTKNHGKHILHGGNKNLVYQFWSAEGVPAEDPDADDFGLRFKVVSPAGDNGFPGEVTVSCEYRWNDQSELSIQYRATTDAPTHVNLTNHSYFNLSGVGSGTTRNHIATIPSDQILEVDDDLIPHGGFVDVEGTPFDFRSPMSFEARIDQLPDTKGYDHCYVVPGKSGQLRFAAEVYDPSSGRTMQVETNAPGMQLYTGNHLGGGASEAGHRSHEAFCLETQYFPNTPNVDSFPSTLIRPGDTFAIDTIYRFGTKATVG